MINQSFNFRFEHYNVPACICFQDQVIEVLDKKSLNESEIKLYNERTTMKGKKNFLSGRLASKKSISTLCAIDQLSEIKILTGEFDQPIVVSPIEASPELSISHSRDWAVALSTDCGNLIGVDIEYNNLNRIEALQEVSSEAEVALFNKNEDVNLFVLWTMKEALAKFLKCGFNASLNILELNQIVENADDSSTIGYFKYFSGIQVQSWKLRDYTISIAYSSEANIDSGLENIEL